MSKRLAWILAAAAALAVIGWILWQKMKVAPPPVVTLPPAPSQPATPQNHSTAIAQSFQGLTHGISNWAAQWFSDTVLSSLPTKGTSAKPPPLNNSAVTDAKDGAMVNPVTYPMYLA